MDHIDRCIVDILQHNARLPVKEIASRVSLSSPAVCARIERLEKSGVLAGYQAMINVTAIGYLVKAFINLEVEPDQKPAFYPYIESFFSDFFKLFGGCSVLSSDSGMPRCSTHVENTIWVRVRPNF